LCRIYSRPCYPSCRTFLDETLKDTLGLGETFRGGKHFLDTLPSGQTISESAIFVAAQDEARDTSLRQSGSHGFFLAPARQSGLFFVM
jgi:hypothetical protein